MMILQGVMDIFTSAKARKEEKSKDTVVDEPKSESQKQFEECADKHADVHNKRINLSDNIVQHIRNNGKKLNTA